MAQDNGTTQEATSDGKPTLVGYDHASGVYQGPQNQPQEEAETTQDPAQELETDMDLTEPSGDSNGLNDLSGSGAINQMAQPSEQGQSGITDAGTAALVRLLQVQREGHTLNITDMLMGRELAALGQVRELLQVLPGPPGKDETSSLLSAIKDSDSGQLTSSSEDDSGDESTQASESGEEDKTHPSEAVFKGSCREGWQCHHGQRARRKLK